MYNPRITPLLIASPPHIIQEGIKCFCVVFIGKVNQREWQQRAQAPTCLRWTTASLYTVSVCHSNFSCTIPVRLTLVVQQLFSGLGGVLCVGRLHDGVDGARLLAEAAVDALGHVNVVAGGAARAVGTLFGFDGDGLGRANLFDSQTLSVGLFPAHCASTMAGGGREPYGFAELAGNASLFARGVSSQRVLATESGGYGALG